MSQVTRCPGCGTSFRVVPDQLRISQGWVRCGQCHEVFDAAQDLRDQAARAEGSPGASPALASDIAVEPLPDAVAAPAAQLPSETDDGDHLPAPTLVDVAPQWLQNAPPEIPVTDPAASLDVGFSEYQQAQRPAEPVLPVVDDAPEAASTETDDVTSAGDATPSPTGPERLFVAITPTVVKAEGASAVDAMPLPQRPAAESPLLTPERPVWRSATPVAPAITAAAPAVDPAHAELSFLREAAEPAPVRAAVAARRGLWGGVSALLALVLLVQWAMHERDRLATSVPALRPLLQVLCLPLQCQVQPLRRIDAIVIDGSAFVALGENGYRLSLTLRNRASHPVAVPSLVLSLTDIQEQPVVRRVLLPQELGTPPAELTAHGEWATSVDLQMADNAGRARVVGYRLDAFYP